MIRFSDYRLRQLGELSTQKGIQTMFECLSHDLKSTIELPELVSENVVFNYKYTELKKEDKEVVKNAFEAICNHGKSHFYQFLVEDAGNVLVSPLSSPDTISNQIKSELMNAIKDFVYGTDGLKSQLMSVSYGAEPEVWEKKTKWPDNMVGQTAKPADPDDEDVGTSTIPNGNPSNANYPSSPRFKIRPKDGFWSGIKRAVVDPIMKWGPIKRFRQRWHGDLNRENTELFETLLIERTDLINKIVDDFFRKMTAWIDKRVPEIIKASSSKTPAVSSPATTATALSATSSVPATTVPASPVTTSLSPTTSSTEPDEVPSMEMGKDYGNITSHKRTSLLKQARGKALEMLNSNEAIQSNDPKAQENKYTPEEMKNLASKVLSKSKLDYTIRDRVKEYYDNKHSTKEKLHLKALGTALNIPEQSVTSTFRGKVAKALLHQVAKSMGVEMPPETEKTPVDVTSVPDNTEPMKQEPSPEAPVVKPDWKPIDVIRTLKEKGLYPNATLKFIKTAAPQAGIENEKDFMDFINHFAKSGWDQNDFQKDIIDKVIEFSNNNPEFKSEPKTPEVKTPDVKVPEIKTPEEKSPEVAPEPIKIEPEIKEPIKTPEIKVPEVKKSSSDIVKSLRSSIHAKDVEGVKDALADYFLDQNKMSDYEELQDFKDHMTDFTGINHTYGKIIKDLLKNSSEEDVEQPVEKSEEPEMNFGTKYDGLNNEQADEVKKYMSKVSKGLVGETNPFDYLMGEYMNLHEKLGKNPNKKQIENFRKEYAEDKKDAVKSFLSAIEELKIDLESQIPDSPVEPKNKTISDEEIEQQYNKPQLTAAKPGRSMADFLKKKNEGFVSSPIHSRINRFKNKINFS